jgi:hypothetical protein
MTTTIDATAAREQAAVSAAVSAGRPTFRGKIAAGTCLACGFVNAVEDETRRTRGMKCGGCGVRVELDYVTGHHNGAVPCNGACQYAIGPWCSCSCGGANHRAGYVAPPEQIPVWVRERDAKRHTAKRERREAKATAARQSAADRVAAARAELFEEWPILRELETDRYADPTWDFIVSMRAALAAGNMSPRQIAASVTAIERTQKRDADRAAADAVKAAAIADGVAVTEGRQAIRGVIVGVKEEPDRFSYSRDAYITKITVACADGTRLYGTFPRDLEPEWTHEIADAYVGWGDRMKGQRVTFVATVQPSKNDPLFGYFKRPAVPADAPRLSHIGPEAQAADGALPTVAPQRPRKPRTAETPALPAAPEVTAEDALNDGLRAGEVWARRTLASRVLGEAVAGVRARGWAYLAGFDTAEMHGTAGTVRVTVNDRGASYDIGLYRDGKRVTGLAGIDTVGAALVAGELYARGAVDRAAATGADVAAVAAAVRMDELPAVATGPAVTVQPLPAARTAATVPAPVADRVADVWSTVVDVWAAVV